MTDVSEGPSRLPWPPVIYLAAIALGFLLAALMPLPWLGSPGADMLLAIGAIAILAGVAIGFSAVRAMRKAQTSIMAHHASEHLVTDGPFSFSRNPIYLAGTLLTAALGLIVGNPWLLLLAPAAAFLTQKLAVEPEERHLDRKFGKRYRDYRKKVRRWI